MCHYNKSGKSRMRELDDASDQRFTRYDSIEQFDSDLDTYNKYRKKLIKKMRRERDGYTIIKKCR